MTLPGQTPRSEVLSPYPAGRGESRWFLRLYAPRGYHGSMEITALEACIIRGLLEWLEENKC